MLAGAHSFDTVDTEGPSNVLQSPASTASFPASFLFVPFVPVRLRDYIKAGKLTKEPTSPEDRVQSNGDGRVCGKETEADSRVEYMINKRKSHDLCHFSPTQVAPEGQRQRPSGKYYVVSGELVLGVAGGCLKEVVKSRHSEERFELIIWFLVSMANMPESLIFASGIVNWRSLHDQDWCLILTFCFVEVRCQG